MGIPGKKHSATPEIINLCPKHLQCLRDEKHMVKEHTNLQFVELPRRNNSRKVLEWITDQRKQAATASRTGSKKKTLKKPRRRTPKRCGKGQHRRLIGRLLYEEDCSRPAA